MDQIKVFLNEDEMPRSSGLTIWRRWGIFGLFL